MGVKREQGKFQSNGNFKILQMFVSGLETSILQMNQMENELMSQNEFLQERICFLEENQDALEKDLREKELQIKKLENLIDAANKKILKQENIEIKTEVKVEITESMESEFQESSEYFECGPNIRIKDDIEGGNEVDVENKETINGLSNSKPNHWKMKKGKWTMDEKIRRRIDGRKKKEKRRTRKLLTMSQKANILESDGQCALNYVNLKEPQIKEGKKTLKERKKEKKEKMKQKKLSKEVRLVELYENGKRKRGIGNL